MSISFNYYLPINIIFGSSKISQLPDEALRLGCNKALIVTGKNSLKASGVLDKITDSLEKNKIESVAFNKVPSDPDTTIVDKGIKLAKEKECDVILGIGGGSAIDTAKAIAGLFNEKDFSSSQDYLEVDGTRIISCVGLPFISVPTVAGTGTEVTKNSVLVNPSTKNKRSIRYSSMFAKSCIIDPELTLSVPKSITAASGIDAFCHLIEGYISKKSNTMTDMIALEGLRCIKKSLVKLYNKLDDLRLREDLSYASLLGGIVISNAGLTLAHGIASVMGPQYNVVHGISCSVILAQVMKYNWSYIPEHKQKTLENMFGSDVPGYILQLIKNLNLPLKLDELNINNDNIRKILKKAVNTSSAKGNPRPVQIDEFLKCEVTL